MIFIASTRRIARALFAGCFLLGGATFAITTDLRAQGFAQSHETLKALFDALPEDDRRAIQDALVWTGDYKGTIDGVLGRGGVAALEAYARRVRTTPEALLGGPARRQLLLDGQKLRNAARFANVQDARTGASVGLPAAVFTRRSDTRAGSRWTNSAGSASLETFYEPDGDLLALYERLRAPTPGRRVTYGVLRPDFLVVSGEDPRGLFYIRAARGEANGRLLTRGYTLVYGRGLQPSFDTFSIAISNAFQPFPTAAAPAPAASLDARTMEPRTQARRRAVEATAIAVTPDRALTALARDCPDMRVADRPAKILRRDAASGLALIETQGQRAVLTPAARALRAGEVVALFATSAGQGASVSLAPGRTIAPTAPGDAWRVTAAVQDGIGGAPVFDRSGGWMGLLAQPAQEPRRIAGIVPQAAWRTIPAESALSFLSASGVKIETGVVTTVEKSAGDIARAYAGALLALSCQR